MKDQDREFITPGDDPPSASPGAEFSTPSPEREFPPPPPEFGAGTAPAATPARNGRKKRFLLLAGAAALYAGALLGGTEPSPPPLPAPPSAAVTTPAPTLLPKPEDTASAPALSARPSAGAPTPLPTAASTPEPSPEPEPVKTEVRAIFLSFSDTLEGAVCFTGQENILGARVRIWDPVIDRSIEELDVPADAVAAGYFRLPTISVYDVYMRYAAEYEAAGNAFPDPELRILCRISGENGEEEQTVTVPNRYELGWSVRYWERDEDPEWGYPDCFAFRTYESHEPVNVAYSREDPQEPGSITVWITVNGRDVTADETLLRPEETTFGGEGPVYYYGNVLVPRPEWAGEHGTAHFTVREYLLGYDEIWVTERDVEY